MDARLAGLPDMNKMGEPRDRTLGASRTNRRSLPARNPIDDSSGNAGGYTHLLVKYSKRAR